MYFSTPCIIPTSGVFCNSFYADGHGQREMDAMGGWCREGLRLGRAMRSKSRGKPDRVLRLRVARLLAGEAQVEAEGDEVTLPVREPMTAATL